MALERPARMTPAMFEYELIERAKDKPAAHRAARGRRRPGAARPRTSCCAAASSTSRSSGDPDDGGGPGRQRSAWTSAGAHLVDPLQSPLRPGFAERYHELRKHKGVTEELALETVGDVTYFGTLMVHAGRGRRHGLGRGAHDRRHDPARPSRSSRRARAFRSCRACSSCACADRVLVYGDCAVNPEAGRRAARRHRDQLGRDRRRVRRRAAHRDAVLLHRDVREGRGRRCGARGDGARARAGAPTSRSRARSSTTPRSTRPWPRRSCRTARLRARRRCSCSPTSNRQHRLQGGPALLGRRRDRPGAAGPQQARQRPQPRLPRPGHRQHGRDHGDPGAGGQRPEHLAPAGHSERELTPPPRMNEDGARWDTQPI